MSISRVDKRHRIVVDKKIRRKTNIRAGDVVILEPLDEHSFRVTVMNFAAEKLEDDPVWKAIHTPVKVEKYIPPKKLEEIMRRFGGSRQSRSEALRHIRLERDSLLNDNRLSKQIVSQKVPHSVVEGA